MAQREKESKKVDKKAQSAQGKITIGQIQDLSFQKAIMRLSNCENLKIATAFKAKRLLKAVRDEVGAFEEIRVKTLESLAEKDQDGKVLFEDDSKSHYKLSPENRAIFTAKLEEAKDVVVALPPLQFTLEELEGSKLSGSDLLALEPFIKE